MNHRWHKDTLERRVAKLEQLIYEKSVGRGGPSIAMNMWSFLMDHGPATKDEIEAGLGPRYSNNPTINSYLNAGLITQRGNKYVANPNYNWDDVGVISRDIPPEVRQMMQDLPDASEIPEEPKRRGRGKRSTEAPAEEPVTRRGRQAREPRVPQIKQNLFSRKYNEVKAAIDAGQDCTAANDKGITPLMFACKDPKGQSGDIVEMLLEHGANANDLEGNKYVIYSALKNNNFAAVKSLINHGADLKVQFRKMFPLEYALEVCDLNDENMETICLLTNESLGGYRRVFNAAIQAVSDKKLSNKWYTELINKTYNSIDAINWISGDERTAAELRNGVCALYDLYIKLTGKMPPLSYYSAHHILSGSRYSKFASDKLYSTIKDVVAGKIKPYSISNLFEVYDVLERHIDGISDFITPEYVIECNKSREGRSELMAAIRYALSERDAKVLQTIAKSKIDTLDGDEIISYIAERAKNDKAITAAACRIVNNCKNTKHEIDGYSALRIARGNNEYLVDWAIDRGYGQELVDAQTRVQLTPYCVKALDEAGFKFDNITSQADRNARYDYKYAKEYIMRLIKNDEWNRTAEEYMRKYPQILTDEDIVDEIKNNPDSLTGRQLQRRIDALPKDPEKYDF